MNHELICAWLGLPAETWPPDHYRLLGLPPGENDPHVIEERVHQRLDAVRRYQMAHPEVATEAMNRIAQAFVCLSEPTSKRVYDANLLGTAVALKEPLTATETQGERLDAAAATVEEQAPLGAGLQFVGPGRAPPIRRDGQRGAGSNRGRRSGCRCRPERRRGHGTCADAARRGDKTPDLSADRADACAARSMERDRALSRHSEAALDEPAGSE